MQIFESEWIDPVLGFWAVREKKGAALLESAYPGHADSRWSYVAYVPAAELTVLEDGALVRFRDSGDWSVRDDWRTVMRELLSDYSASIPKNAPPFCGGWIGWLGYELGSQFDRIAVISDSTRRCPLACLSFYTRVECFDHHERRRWIVCLDDDQPEAPISQQIPFNSPLPELTLKSNFEKADYLEAVERAIEYIRAGDIYQVNLSQQFTAALPLSGPDIYFRLRKASPAPFSAYLASDYGVLVSSSPELFLSVDESGKVVSRPIKGTRQRGLNHESDVTLAQELKSSEKDHAENIMIVDLVRNDLSRVCQTGSVITTEICRLEMHPTVFHLVSTVKGVMGEGKDFIDLLAATFPGGSVTGAPKIRSCEVISELERARRGPYTGAYGYFSLNGSVKLAMTIRALWSDKTGITFNVGGGIVADSDPATEYEETLHKASGLLRALESD